MTSDVVITDAEVFSSSLEASSRKEAGAVGETVPEIENDPSSQPNIDETVSIPTGEPISDTSAESCEEASAFEERVVHAALKVAAQRELEEREEDNAALSTHLAAACDWLKMCGSLKQRLQADAQSFLIVLASLPEVPLTVSPALATKLKGRCEGLLLIGRMMERLQLRADGLLDQEQPVETLPNAFGLKAWLVLKADGGNDSALIKRIDAELRDRGEERYQIVSAARRLAEGRRNRLFHFLSKQVLPLLDGLDDGERYSRPLWENPSQQEDAAASLLNILPGVYSDLRHLLLETLAVLEVKPIAAQRGDTIDYNKHEPFDVEPDLMLEDEQIKEVIRVGYEWLREIDAPVVLRPTQVTVVKNGA